jgi:hypothetical protein
MPLSDTETEYPSERSTEQEYASTVGSTESEYASGQYGV